MDWPAVAADGATGSCTTAFAQVDVNIPTNKAGDPPKQVLISGSNDFYWKPIRTGETVNGSNCAAMARAGPDQILRLNVHGFNAIAFSVPTSTTTEVKVIPLENG